MRFFVSEFLLPLVTGGPVHVGPPLAPAELGALIARVTGPRSSLPQAEAEALASLARCRGRLGRQFLWRLSDPSLEAVDLQVAASIHNILLLGHPALTRPSRLRDRVAGWATEQAAVGPPGTSQAAVERYTLLAQLPHITRPEHQVALWFGQRHFVGRSPPRTLLAWPTLRRVKVTSTKPGWLTEVGVALSGRQAWRSLQLANPLGDALDPMRLDPPLRWASLVQVARSVSLGRIVADKILALGLDTAGEAWAEALFTVDESPHNGADLAVALRFFSHLVWLDLLLGTGSGSENLGPGLSAWLVAAMESEPGLVWPPDVAPDSDLGRRFDHRLAGLRQRATAGAHHQLETARALVRICRSPDHKGIVSQEKMV